MPNEARMPKKPRGGVGDRSRNPYTQKILDSAYKMQKQGNLQQAEVFYHQVLQDEPGNPFALYALGAISISRQEFEKAIPLLRESISNGYHAETSYTHLGIALQSTGRFQEALELYRAGAKLDPKNPHYPSNMAVVLTQLGQTDQALVEAQRAMKLDPKFASAYLNAGGILQSVGRRSEAIHMYEKAAHLDPVSQEARNALRRLMEEPSPSGS
jgi:tetratricopeptide (TPR) repeat protein